MRIVQVVILGGNETGGFGTEQDGRKVEASLKTICIYKEKMITCHGPVDCFLHLICPIIL
jgi:hypothetical protein